MTYEYKSFLGWGRGTLPEEAQSNYPTHPGLEVVLNYFAEQDWRLVAIFPDPTAGPQAVRIVLEREKTKFPAPR